MEERIYFDRALSAQEIQRMSDIVVEIGELEIAIYKVAKFDVNNHGLYSESKVKKSSVSEYDDFQIRRRNYWHQIYYLLSHPNWVERLKDWINLLAPPSLPQDERLSQISQIKNQVMNLIPRTESNPTWRLSRKLFSHYGYDAGFEILRELYKVEKDEKIKSNIAEILEKTEKISKLDYTVPDDHTPDQLFDILDKIIKILSEMNLSKPEILDYLYSIGLYYYYRKSNMVAMGADHFADYIDKFREKKF